MSHPTVFNTSEVCYQLEVRHAVMSPGSRNAPLTISFARHQKIKKWIIPDERSAAFVALGIAQECEQPVVLCCTSGTALLNYAPAIAEAYYREIPLIILSADRPPELIDQRDGQTIRQFEALKNHVKASYQLPLVSSETSASKYQSELIEAIQDSQILPKGPVHINIPFKEPFYPREADSLNFKEVDLAGTEIPDSTIPSIDLKENSKVLILIGQQGYDKELTDLLTPFTDKFPIISTPLNNLEIGIKHVDGFIDDQEELKPDVLITSGLSVLSKKLKIFLRENRPNLHLHFDPSGVPVDTYQSSPQLIQEDIKSFLPQLKKLQVNDEYLKKWNGLAKKTSEAINSFMHNAEYSETSASYLALKHLPEGGNLHLGNSMPVRFADLFDSPAGLNVFSNRGTSGIDGCTSTSFGTALISNKLNTLITGDLAFLYDRNAFFNNYQVENLRVIVMNNKGGGIFRLINGPSRLPELEDYFETRHNKTAEYICAENKLEYIPVANERDLKKELEKFWEPSKSTKIMEVFTDPETNQETYKNLRKYIHEHIND